MKVILKSKRNTHFATAEYKEGVLTILPGSKINTTLSYEAMAESIKALRSNTDMVSSDGIVLKKITFSSPSAAAQFVTGRSVNGYISWRIDDKISLKEYRNQKK